MTTIIVRLDPDRLVNPDLGLRYAIPDMLKERSGGLIEDDGFDYVDGSSCLDVFLEATDADAALRYVLDMIENDRVLENDLRATTVAVEQVDGYFVVYPPTMCGTRLPNRDL